MLTPANGARSCPALPSHPAATGAALLASGAGESLSVPLVLGALREVSTAEPLNASLMVAFEMAACNCQQRLKNKCHPRWWLLGAGVQKAAVTKEPPRCGRLGSGPRGSTGVPAWVEVPKKGAVAAS